MSAPSETLAWWVITATVWAATLTTFSTAELVSAAVCTLPCAVLARWARRANAGHWRFQVGWLRWALTVLRELPRQAGQAWAYALAPGRSRRSTIDVMALPREPNEVASARRAAAVLALATTPGTVVLDSDAHTGRLLLHRLQRRRGALETQVGS